MEKAEAKALSDNGLRLQQSLVALRPRVSQVRGLLEVGDYALAQGTLRGVYNVIAEILEKSQLQEPARTRISGLNAVIFDTRNTLVEQIEVVRRSIPEAVSVASTYEKLKVIDDLFGLYTGKPEA